MTNSSYIKVLIVDDEILIRQGIRYLVDWEKEGFEIIGEAANGEEALNMIKLNQPHIVITDIVMPVMDGESLIKVIKRDYPDIEIIVLSSFDLFEYVRSSFQNGAVDYILKPNLNPDELLEILKKIATTKSFKHTEKLEEQNPKLKQIIDNLLIGFEKKLNKEQLQLLFPFQYYFLIGMIGPNMNTSLEIIIENEFPQNETICFYNIKKEKTESVYLINTKMENIDIIKNHLKSFCNLVKKSFPKTRCVLSKPFQSITETKEIYEKNVKKMYTYLFYLPNTNILIYDQLPKKVKKGSKEFRLSIFLDILKHSFKDAKTYLEEYINDLISQYDRDIFTFKSFLGNIIFNVTVFLRENGYEQKDLEQEQYQYFLKINESFHVNEAIDYVKDYFHKVEKILCPNEINKHRNHIYQLLNYINQNFNQPLTLTDLAEKFHFNPSYLSAYFSKHHREGFSEYVNRLRIEKAKELLESSNMPISEIGYFVGYSDQSYFSKVFKKIVGRSPSSYRKMKQIRNDGE